MVLFGAKAIEFRPNRTTISAEHADLNEIAGLDVGGQEEGAGHMIEVVAGRAIEAESRHLGFALGLTQQRDREAPANMRGVEQRAIGAIIDIEFLPAALFAPSDPPTLLSGSRATGPDRQSVG